MKGSSTIEIKNKLVIYHNNRNMITKEVHYNYQRYYLADKI